MEIRPPRPDPHQRRRHVLVRHLDRTAEKLLLLLDIEVPQPEDPQRVGAELVLVDEATGIVDELKGLRACLAKLAVAAAAGVGIDRLAAVGPGLGDIGDEGVAGGLERTEVGRHALLERLSGFGEIGPQMVAADRHRVGDIGDVAGEAAVDIEPLPFRAVGLVAVVCPGLGLEERDERHLRLELLRVAAAMVGHEELLVPQDARLDAVGTEHGDEDPEEVGGIGKEPGEILGKQKTTARAAGGGNVLVEALEVEEGVGDPLGKLRLRVVGIGVGEQHRRMTQPAVGRHPWCRGPHHRCLRPHKPQCHRVLLAEVWGGGMESVAEIHLCPPRLAELVQGLHPSALGRIVRLLRPRFVERLQAVVVPHRTGGTETGIDLQFSGGHEFPGGDQRLLLLLQLPLQLREHRLPILSQMDREADTGILPQRGGRLRGELAKPEEIERAVVASKRRRRRVRQRRDATETERAALRRQGRRDVVVDLSQPVEAKERAMLGKRCGSLSADRRDGIETQHPLVAPERGSRRLRERLEPLEAEIALVLGEKLRLPV